MRGRLLVDLFAIHLRGKVLKTCFLDIHTWKEDVLQHHWDHRYVFFFFSIP